MPLYSYKCMSCNKKFDSVEKIDTKLSYCSCGKSGQRVFCADNQSFTFKGRCWSKYGYEGKSNHPENDPEGL